MVNVPRPTSAPFHVARAEGARKPCHEAKELLRDELASDSSQRRALHVHLLIDPKPSYPRRRAGATTALSTCDLHAESDEHICTQRFPSLLAEAFAIRQWKP